MYGETTEDKAGDGPGCVVHNEALGKEGGGGEERKRKTKVAPPQQALGGLGAVTTMDQQRAPVQRVRNLSLKTEEAEPRADKHLLWRDELNPTLSLHSVMVAHALHMGTGSVVQS